MSQFWSPVVHALSPYTPGEQPKIDGLIKLNTNENPYPPSPRAVAAISSARAAAGKSPTTVRASARTKRLSIAGRHIPPLWATATAFG